MTFPFMLLIARSNLECGDASHLVIENENTIISILPNIQCVKIPSKILHIKEGSKNDYVFKPSAPQLNIVDFSEAKQLKTIGSCAFYSCASLKSIDLSQCLQLSSIGYLAFAYCYSATSLLLPNSSLSIIPAGCFSSCKSLKTVTIPSNIEVLADESPSSNGLGIFSYCSNLKELLFYSDSRLRIFGRRVFEGAGIKSLFVPKSVESIGGITFRTSTSLESIIVEDGNKKYKTIDNCLYDFNQGLVYYPTKATPGFVATVHPTTTVIRVFAFLGVNSYKTIILPSGLMSIESSAFYDFNSLNNITIPPNVNNIGSTAFYSCKSLTNITFENYMESIPSSLFYNCIRLKTFQIPNMVISISNEAFAFCSSLSLVYVPKSVQTFGSGIFTNCASNLTLVFENGSDIIYINDYLYSQDMTRLIVYLGASKTAKIVSSVKTICKGAFTSRSIEKVEYDYQQNITSIESYSFSACKSLSSIILPENIKSIEPSTFAECANLKEIEINSKITEIKEYAFQKCTSLEKVTFNEGLTSIEKYAFYTCTLLSQVVLPNTLQKIDIYAFCKTYALKQINIPSSLSFVGEYSFSDSGILSLRFSGATAFVNISRMAFTQMYYLKSIEFVDYVEQIMENSFASCENLETISIGASVSFIDEYAFTMCYGLKNVIILDNARLLSLSLLSFDYCLQINLFSVNEHNNNFYFEDGILYNRAKKVIFLFLRSTGAKEISIPSNVESISGHAFYSCPTIEKVIFNGKSINSIGVSAFENCTALHYFNFPSSLSFIGANAFLDCNLYSVTLSTTLITEIKASVFSRNKQLTRISLPIGLSSCSSTAFSSINRKAIIFYFGENIILSQAGLSPTCKVICFENYLSKTFLGLPVTTDFGSFCSVRPHRRIKSFLIYPMIFIGVLSK